jgi:hypothetical protein
MCNPLPKRFRLTPSGLQTSPHTSQQLTPTVTLPTPPGQSLQGNRASAGLRLAIQRHLDKLPVPEKEGFREAAKTINKDILLFKARKCDDAHKHTSSFRPQAERLGKLPNLLDRFMGGAVNGIQTHPEISSLVVGGVRIIIDLAINFVEFFSKRADMLWRFEDYLEPLADFASIPGFYVRPENCH